MRQIYLHLLTFEKNHCPAIILCFDIFPSLQALLTMMDRDYHKMIRNSAKILRRTEKATKTPLNVEDDDAELERLTGSRGGTASLSGESHITAHSALSLSKRIHMTK